MLTQSRLEELFHYDRETGIFTRRVRTGSMAGIGTEAGCKNNLGYIVIGINKKLYKAHRLAWLYMTGEWPKDHIDHINGATGDNRFANLREASHAENMQNMAKNKNNTSGFMGVSWCKNRKKWRALISVAGRDVDIGRFATPEDAYAAYLAAKAKYHTFNPVPNGG